jgi:hypothetical protein
MVHGLWFMVHGSWFMVYGLWYMVYDLWFFMVSNLKWRDLVFGWVCVHDERTLKPVAIQ